MGPSRISDIIRGLCEAMARNYLNNVAKGKDVEEPIMFQGGVAANAGMRKALKKALNLELIVPKNFDVMGAIGAAILAQEEMARNPRESTFYGWNIPEMTFESTGFECHDCPNFCEVVEIRKNQHLIARWGSKCGKWEDLSVIREEVYPEISFFSLL